MATNLCDEIEYFEFAPQIFIRELIDEVTHAVENNINTSKLILSTTSKRKAAIKNFLLQLINKNFFIFQNYVLKTVFTFPTDFHYERKITDLRCNDNIQKFVDEIYQIYEEEKYLRSELIKIEGDYEIEMCKKKFYENLLSNEKEILDSIEKTKKAKLQSNENDATYKKFINKKISESACKSNTIEFKEFKMEVLKSERDKLLDISDVEELSFYAKNLK